LAVVTKRLDIATEVAAFYPLTSLSEVDLLRLGEAYRRIQDYKNALPIYQQLVLVMPQNAKYRATYAALLAHEGRIEEARKETEEVIKLDPTFIKEGGSFLQNLKSQ